MAADQKIELELALRDTVSLTLKTIAENLDKVNAKLLTKGGGGEGISEGVDALKKIQTHTENLSRTAKTGSDIITGFTQTILQILPSFMAGPGGAIAGTVAIGTAIGKLGVDALRNSAAERLRLHNMSIDTGLSGEKIDILRQYGQRRGYAKEDTDKLIGDLAGGIRDMASLDTKAPMFQHLADIDQTGLAWELLKLAKAGDIDKAVDTALKAIDKAKTEKEKHKLADALVGGTIGFSQDYEEGIKGLTAGYTMSLETSKKFLAEIADLYKWTGDISTTVMDWSIKIAERALEVTEATNQMLDEKIRPDIRDQAERKRMGLAEATDAELDAVIESRKKKNILQDMIRSLKLSTDPTITPRQFGGLVQSGRPYLVGERGPEMFKYGSGQSRLVGEGGADLFMPESSGVLDPFDKRNRFKGVVPAPRGATPGETWDALNRSFKRVPNIGIPEGSDLPGQPGSGSTPFGNSIFDSLLLGEKEIESGMWRGYPDVPFGQHPGQEGSRGGGVPWPRSTEGQRINFMDGALGGASSIGLGGELSFINVPPGVETSVDNNGFDSFRVNKTRQLQSDI